MVKNPLDNIKGVVFDLDGTIVDSKLDFSLMRKDLGIEKSHGILEEIELIKCNDRKSELLNIVRDHELKGARESELMSGFKDFYHYLLTQKIPIGILTRNSLEVTEITLSKFNLSFDLILTRDCCEPKPSPAGLIKVMEIWNMQAAEIIYIGDSKYDQQTAKNAQVKSVLFKSIYNEGFTGEFDYSVNCFTELIPSR